MTRYCLLAVGSALAALGCSGSREPDYKFGAAEMEQLVVGTWSGVWGADTPDAGPDDAGAGDAETGDADLGEVGASDTGTGLVPFTLRIERQVRSGARPLCDPRSLSRGGSGASLHPLCIATSEMPVGAMLDVSDGSLTAVELTGMLRVPGEQLREADLSLKAANADVAIVAQWVVGKWLFCRANHTTGRYLAACTLDSRTP